MKILHHLPKLVVALECAEEQYAEKVEKKLAAASNL